jgi:sulfite reductase (NADPH) flavoprotein alpha-component
LLQSLQENASVTLVSPKHSLSELVSQKATNGELAWLNRSFEHRDLLGKQVCFADSELDSVQLCEVARLCKQERVLLCANDSISSDFTIFTYSRNNSSPNESDRKSVSSDDHTVGSEEASKADQKLASMISVDSDTSLVNAETDFIHRHEPVIGVSSYSNASSALSQVSYALSDIAFVFPAFESDFIGKELLEMNAKETTNITGKTTKVVKMTTRTGAGQVAQGASSSSLKASLVLSSAGLDSFLPSLYNMSRNGPPSVFHVGLQTIASDLQIHGTLDPVYKVAASNAVILVSSSVQETHDMAVASHLVAYALGTPAVHFFDGVQLPAEDTRIQTSTESELRSMVKDSRQANSFASVFKALSAGLGRVYAPFQYFGHESATTMVVSMGAAKTSISQAVGVLNAEGAKFGFVNVLLYRPWQLEAFLDTLPRTTARIVVVDYVSTKPGLLQDVQASFYGRKAPEVFGTSFENANSLNPGAVESFLRGIETKSVLGLIRLDTAAASHYDEETFTALVIDAKSDSSMLAQRNVFNAISDESDLFSQRIVRHVGDLEPITVSQFRISHSPIVSRHRVGDVHLILCHDLSALKTFDIVSSAGNGSTLVINTNVKDNDLSAELPYIVKQQLVERQIKVIAVDAHQIAKDYTIFFGEPEDYVNEILESLFYHFAFNKAPKKAASIFERQRDRIKSESISYNVAYTKLEAIERGLKAAILVKITIGEEQENVKLLPLTFGIPSNYVLSNAEKSTDISYGAVESHNLLLPLAFPHAFKAVKTLKPDGTYRVKVSANMRLTPETYDRNVFHLELDTTGTGLKYEIGEALSIHAPNDANEVASFLKAYGLDAKQIVSVRYPSEDEYAIHEVRTIEQLLIHKLDIFGKPGKKFYQYLAVKITSDAEKEEIAALLKDSDEFERYVEEHTPTYADLLLQYPSAKLTANDLARNIPETKPRLYSISSSQRVHPNSIHLLIVLVDWKTKMGKLRYGQATRFLVNAKIGDGLTVSIKPSVMKLPESHEAPVIMSGLGTGMAPFRAFIEDRWYWKQQGKKVGPMILYFGSRYREMEYLYGEELDAYLGEGVLTSLRLAFSRDQPEKIYIQHKIEEDAALLHELIVKQKGSFYLCGPTWPVPDVTNALLTSFGQSMEKEGAENFIEELKSNERFVLEVY